MPPINLLNYSIHRDWFDNGRWLKVHSKETATKARTFRAVNVAKINEIMRGR
ncbi:MAG: hypothetical protein RL755_62 [Pseudomonadota bacterium]|jgi:hypothetical protein